MRPIHIICNLCSRFLIMAEGDVLDGTYCVALCEKCKNGKEVFIGEDKVEQQFQELIKNL